MLRLQTETNLIWILLAIFSVATGPAIALKFTPTTALASTQGAASMFIIGPDGITKSMELKATKETSGPKPVEGFKLGVENVVSIPLNGIASVFGDVTVQFTGAKLTPPSSQQTVDIPITNGKIDFAGIAAGVYTLDVIVADKFAYECLIVIGQNTAQAKQVITNEITEKNTHTTTDVKIVFEKGKNKHNPKANPCYFKPNDDPSCKPVNGKCPDGMVMNEQGNCHPQGKCPKGFETVNDDESGTCYSKKNTFHCPKSGAIVLHKNDCAIYEPDLTPTPTPTPEPKALVATPTPEPTEEPLDSICGGVPCTASEKEGGTTSDEIPDESELTPDVDPDPEPDVDEEEEGIEEEEDVPEENDASADSNSDKGGDSGGN